MSARPPLAPELLKLDAAREADRICDWIRATAHDVKRRGAVVAFSGGIDSSVVGALCVRALGKENVAGLLMPEEDSGPETLGLSTGIVEHLGISYRLENLTPILAAVGCYRRRDEAIRSVVPDYQGEWEGTLRVTSCTQTGVFVDIAFCGEVGAVNSIEGFDLSVTQTGETLSVMLYFGDDSRTVGTSVAPDGSAAFTGNFTFSEDGVTVTADSAWRLNSTRVGALAGTVNDVFRVTGFAGEGRVAYDIQTASRPEE